MLCLILNLGPSIVNRTAQILELGHLDMAHGTNRNSVVGTGGAGCGGAGCGPERHAASHPAPGPNMGSGHVGGAMLAQQRPPQAGPYVIEGSGQVGRSVLMLVRRPQGCSVAQSVGQSRLVVGSVRFLMRLRGAQHSRRTALAASWHAAHDG
jgi:hypothetical protein